MIDMLKTLADVEASGKSVYETFNLHIWLTLTQYAYESERIELGNQMAQVIRDDFNFEVSY